MIEANVSEMRRRISNEIQRLKEFDKIFENFERASDILPNGMTNAQKLDVLAIATRNAQLVGGARTLTDLAWNANSVIPPYDA